MSTKPRIELTIDEMEGMKPASCLPYVWVVLMPDRSGCAVECDIYTSEEAPGKLQEFLSDVGNPDMRTVYEAVDCKLHDIEGDDAVDAISMALLKYFESDDCVVGNTFYEALFDVDFVIKTAWNGESDSFILHPDGELSFLNEK